MQPPTTDAATKSFDTKSSLGKNDSELYMRTQANFSREANGTNHKLVGNNPNRNNEVPLNNEMQPPTAFNMTNPMDTMFRETAGLEKSGEIASPRNPEINTKLAQTILVSSADSGSDEVRITLSNDVLPDTEIRISRDINGTLNVSLISNNANSYQTLVQGQFDLKAALEQTENDVKVNVESGESGTSGDDGDSSRQSRNYQGYVENQDEE